MAVLLRPLFKWKYSSVLIPVFFGLAVAMMTWNNFPLTYTFFILSGLWAIAQWILSDSVKSGRTNLERFKEKARRAVAVLEDDPEAKAATAKISKYRNARRSFCGRVFGGIGAVVMLTGICLAWTYRVEESYKLSLLEGKLYPANEPTPSNICKDMEDTDIIVFLGSNAAVIKTFPHTVLKVKGKEILIVNRESDGSLAVTLDVFSKDGRIVARITDGQFVINPNNVLTMKRTDPSNLQVVDQYGTQVLNMRYLNRQAMWIDAVLYYPGITGPISLNGSKSNTGFYDNCSRNVATDIEFN